jgi:hypothetical protein
VTQELALRCRGEYNRPRAVALAWDEECAGPRTNRTIKEDDPLIGSAHCGREERLMNVQGRAG